MTENWKALLKDFVKYEDDWDEDEEDQVDQMKKRITCHKR